MNMIVPAFTCYSFLFFVAVRKLSLFYKLFLIDPELRKAQQLCPFVTTGTMHNEFQKYLRPDRLGIDYAYLEDFDTAAELKRKGKFFG